MNSRPFDGFSPFLIAGSGSFPSDYVFHNLPRRCLKFVL